MSETGTIWDGRKFWRLAGLAAGITASGFLAWFALEQLPMVVFWRAGLVFAIALEVVYGMALLVCLVGVPVQTVLLARARKRQRRRPAIARGLLLCVSVLLSLAMAEATAAIVRAYSRRSTAVPVGGLGRDPRAAEPTRLPDPPDRVQFPEVFPDPPRGDGDEVDLVVVGESSAAGVPYNFWFSMGSLLAWQIEEAIPGRRIQLNVVAQTGDTLQGQHEKLAGLTRRPDVLVIYCGHNEFSARFPWSRELDHYHDAGARSPWERFVARVERTSPLCGLIREAIDKCRVAIPPPPGGNRALVDVPAYTPEEYESLLADFRRRLDAIVSYAGRIGALPILIAPPGNDSDFEPNRSFLPPETRAAERAAFASEFRAVRRSEGSDPEGALRGYRKLLVRQPGFAETHYRLARLMERSGDWDEAYRHDVAARDLDGLPMRCPTAFQDVYRDVASRHQCILIDGQAEFHSIGRRGLLDDSLFHDGMHPSLRGIIALSQAILRELHARRALGWPEGSAPPTIDPGLVARHYKLGSYAWSKLCHWGIMFYDKTGASRYDSSERYAKQDAFGKAADRIDAGAAAESVGLPGIGIPEPVPALPVSRSP